MSFIAEGGEDNLLLREQANIASRLYEAAMNWDKIVGHKENIELLRGMLTMRLLPHALLFTGPQGVGKMLSARIFAAGILCEAKEARPCGVCLSCLSYSRGGHPDALEIRPASGGASQTVKIDQIRALKRFALLSPALTEGRVCVVEDAQNMTAEAANSLLKLLEEPPPNFHFILMASIGQPLIPTIVSRCLRLDFLPLPPVVLAGNLREKFEVSPEKAWTAANLSGGRLGKALELLQPEGLVLRDRAAEYLELVSGSNAEISGEFLEFLASLGKQDVVAFLEYAGTLVRDMLCILVGNNSGTMQETAMRSGLLSPDLAGKLANLAPYWAEERLFAAYQNLRLAVRAILSNASVMLTIDALTIKLKC